MADWSARPARIATSGASVLVHQPSDAMRDLHVLRRGVQASDLAGLLAALRGH